MDRRTAEAHIRFLAEADKIAPTQHAKTRAPKAGKFPLTRAQMRECLIHGSISEGPTPDIRETDGWRFTMRRFRAGTNTDEKHEVAGVLIVEKKVIVITGYGWGKTVSRVTSRKSKHRDEQDDDGLQS
jgi:hypothetical protein